MSLSAMLAQPRLTVITAQVDSELLRIRDAIEHKLLVDGRSDLEAVLGQLLASVGTQAPIPKTLDLVGHSVPGTGALQLGNWIIDVAKPSVTAFFRGLADQDVLPRLGIHAVRLLGCRTAETAQARRTILSLADILGLEVFGSTNLIFANHYNAAGFDPSWRFLLVAASDLRRETITSSRIHGSATSPLVRSLDLDSLPSTAADSIQPWPCHIADVSCARSLLRLIRRNEGAWMPGLLAIPRCEVFIAAQAPETFHRVQIVLDGDFVRVYPDGPTNPGILYPVTDPQSLRALVDRLPVFGAPTPQGEDTQRRPWL